MNSVEKWLYTVDIQRPLNELAGSRAMITKELPAGLNPEALKLLMLDTGFSYPERPAAYNFRKLAKIYHCSFIPLVEDVYRFGKSTIRRLGDDSTFNTYGYDLAQIKPTSEDKLVLVYKPAISFVAVDVTRSTDLVRAIKQRITSLSDLEYVGRELGRDKRVKMKNKISRLIASSKLFGETKREYIEHLDFGYLDGDQLEKGQLLLR